MSKFMQDYLKVKFKKREQALQFAILLFFSLEEHSLNSLEIENIRHLFQHHSAKRFYLVYEKVKKTIFHIKRSRPSAFDSLDTIFLTLQEILALSDRIFGSVGLTGSQSSANPAALALV